MSTMTAAAPAIVDINLLPAIHRPRQVTWSQIAIAAALAITLVAMIPLAFRLEAARSDARTAQQLAQQSEIELEGLQSELAQQRALRVETDTTLAQLDVLTAKRELFQGGQRSLAIDLFWLYGYGFLPPGARIVAVAATQGGLTVDGTATDPLDGIAYARSLVEAGGFPSARMSSFTPGDQTGGQFSVEVTR